MWSFGLYNLGLSDYQLWQLTLKEYGLLVDRYTEKEEIADRRIGRILAMIANANRDPKKGKPYTEEDFIAKKKRHVSNKPQTVEEQKAILARLGV